MRALLIQCHPSPESFTAGIGALTQRVLREGGAAVQALDLYAEGFDPVLSREGWEGYRDARARGPVARHVEALRWADALVFVYPTWWYGLPAMLKGWLDRVLLPDVAFVLPDAGPIRPALTHIRQLAVFTTCGASPLLTFAVGAPGKRTLLRGVRPLCAPTCRRYFAAHYRMDSSTSESRARHLTRVEAQCRRMLAHRRRDLPQPEGTPADA